MSWLFSFKPKHNASQLPSLSCIFLIAFYIFAIYSFVVLFGLDKLNLLIIILALILISWIFGWIKNQKLQSLLNISALIIFFVTGIFYPICITENGVIFLDGSYQQDMLKVTDKLSTDGSYVGGVPFLYQKDQAIDGIKNLIGPALEYLYTQDPKLETLLLASIYLVPRTQTQILNDFENSSVKTIVMNYRMLMLPPAILHYIGDHYQQFYGSVYLYAPKIFARHAFFNIKFNGNYRLVTNKNTDIVIDGKHIKNQQKVVLKKGMHASVADSDYRLFLVPDINKAELNPLFYRNDWIRMYKAIIM